MDLTPFNDLIRKRTGLSVDRNLSAKVGDEIRRKMSERGIRSSVEYFKLLLRDQNEFLSILNFLTINETYFFREPVHFELLTRRLIPELLKRNKPGRVIKILSAGCSTGEEPYSIAIALIEKYGSDAAKRLFRILGIDIDKEVIERTKKGIYRKQSFRSPNPGWIDAYFDSIDSNTYKIKEDIQEMVDFYCSNLMEVSSLDVVRGVDIIFYRNVSIYFEADIRKAVFKSLSQLLNDNGYLIVSSTETLSHSFNILPLVEMEGVFLFQKTAETLGMKEEDRSAGSLGVFPHSARHEKAPIFPYGEERRQPNLANPTETPVIAKDDVGSRSVLKNEDTGERRNSLYEEALDLAGNKMYPKAMEILDRLMKTDPSFVKAYTLKAGILINLQQMEEAKKLCLKAVETDPLCAEGYFFLGIVAKEEARHEEAVKRFKESIYVKSSSWPAHYYLAEIYRSTAKDEHARREYGVVLKLLQKGAFSDHGLAFFPFSFSEKQVIHLCRRNMEQLSA